jgi:hypothetical protein
LERAAGEAAEVCVFPELSVAGSEGQIFNSALFLDASGSVCGAVEKSLRARSWSASIRPCCSAGSDSQGDASASCKSRARIRSVQE